MVSTIEEYRVFCLHILKYDLFDHIEKDLPTFSTLSPLNSIPHERFPVNIKQTGGRTLQKR